MTIGGCGLGLRTFSCALSDSGSDVRGYGPRPVYDFHSPKQKTAIEKQETEPRPPNIIQIDQNLLETRLERFGAEADEIAEAVRYERSGRWEACHDGHYDRSLIAKVSRLGLKVSESKVHLDWGRHNHYQSSWCFSSRSGNPRKRHPPPGSARKVAHFGSWPSMAR